MIWPGTILVYYGAMFVVGAVLFTWRARWVLVIGAAAALAGAGIAWWAVEARRDGHDTSWLFDPPARSPRGVVFDVFVNGTHPLLPWLAFFCAGIVLGRVLHTTWWRPVAIGAGATMFAVATATSAGAPPRCAWPTVLASTDPFDRGVLYTASALGTALVAFGAVSWLADRYRGSTPIVVLRHAGAMSLTIYVGHALLFNLLVDWWDGSAPPGSTPRSACRPCTGWRRSSLRHVAPSVRDRSGRVALPPARRLSPAGRGQVSSLNVLHWRGSPVSKPRRNHDTRCSDVPCVNVSGSTRIPAC